MSATVLNGTELAKRVKEGMAEEVEQLKAGGKNPGLAVVIVEGDPASRVYVNAKRKDCEDIGVESFEYALPNDTTEEELLSLIDRLNADDKIDAMLVQLPLPEHIDEKKVINRIDPAKDADCFHPMNVGLLTTGNPSFQPCTPAGIMELIKRAVEAGYWHLYRYDPRRKEAGENPFQLDSPEPTGDFQDFLMGETRYAALNRTFPENAEKLQKLAAEDMHERYLDYKKLAERQE